MSAVLVNGVRYAAGLDWLPRVGALETAREARKVGSVWCAYEGAQTGYAGESADHEKGMPVLAAALRALVRGERWTVVVACEDGKWAVVQAGDGVILGTGDRVFSSGDEALAAVEEGRSSSSRIYVVGISIEGAEALDVSALGREVALEVVPFAWVTRRVALVAAGIVVGGVSGVVALIHVDALVGLLRGTVEKVEKVAEVTEEARVAVGLDSVALVEGCREAVRRYVPEIPGWERVSLTCRARFAEGELIAVRPVFEGRPVMAVRWRIAPGRRVSLYRQIAEGQLEKWKRETGSGLEGLVEGGRAWVAAVLPPVAVVWEGGNVGSRLALRKAVDMRFGAVAEDIRHADADGSVRIRTAEPLGSIAKLLEGMDGFEVVGLSRNQSGWDVEGRGVKTVIMPESKFRALTGGVQ